MKGLNMFSRLSQEDQTLVLDLCAKLPYRKVVEQLAQPRDQGGLALVTSESSLCTFYTRHNPESAAIEAAGQYAAAVQVNQQAHGEANFEAILALARVQKCFLADVKYRHKNDHVSDAYLDHIKLVARLDDEAEFIRNDVEHDPGAGAVTIHDFQDEQNQYERDVDNAQSLPAHELMRTTTFLRGAARIIAARIFSQRQRGYIELVTGKPALAPEQYDVLSSSNPQQLLATMKANAAATAAKHPADLSTPGLPSEMSESGTPKTPAISHISPNFASPNPSAREKHA